MKPIILHNPKLKQFNLKISQHFLYEKIADQNSIPVGHITFSQLPEELKTDIPVYIFGNYDYESTFRKQKLILDIDKKWDNQKIQIFDNETIPNIFKLIYSNDNIKLHTGDYVFSASKTYQSTIPDPDPQNPDINVTEIYQRFIIIESLETGYGSILSSINSDIFKIARLKLLGQVGEETQFKNQLILLKTQIFGNSTINYISPIAFVGNQTKNTNISDIPMNLTVDKNLSLNWFIKPQLTVLQMNFFISNIKKP